MDEDLMITISKDEYDELMSDSLFLICLNSVGVDNWSGYDEAQTMYQEEYQS